MEKVQNLILGAGPSGLAVAARFEKNNIPYLILEKSNRAGFMWTQHYERLHLHTLKQHSALPYLPFPDHYPEYVPRDQVAEYLANYAEEMGIQPKYNTTVKWIEKVVTGNSWKVETDQGDYLTDNVIIAIGQNRNANRPKWEGIESFDGEVLHTKNYRNAKAYKGKKVLVIGAGNTGAELAMELIECGAESFISVRRPINVIPREIFGRSYQLSAITMEKVPNAISDFIGRTVQKFVVGDLTKYGLGKPTMSPGKQMRLYRKTPLIDIGTIDHIKKGNIKVMPDVKSFSKTSVLFVDGQELEFDVVILATGYRRDLDQILEDASSITDNYGYPNTWEFPKTHPGLYFLGYMEFNSGLLRAVNIISDWILKRVKKRMQETTNQPNRKELMVE